MNAMNKHLGSAWWMLRIGLGVGPFLAGLDKFFNLLTDWEMYLSPLAERFLPFSATMTTVEETQIPSILG